MKKKNIYVYPTANAGNNSNQGMTLLDYFAGQALASSGTGYGVGHERATAKATYELAEAMLEEREKRIKGYNDELRGEIL